MGRKIWTGLALGSVVTVSLFFLLDLFDVSWRSRPLEVLAFAACFGLFAAVGFVFDRIFYRTLSFIHDYLQPP